MPLFGSRNKTPPPTQSRSMFSRSQTPPPQQSRSMFSRRRSSSPSVNNTSRHSMSHTHHTTTSTTSPNRHSGGLTNILHRNEDASITNARSSLIQAEHAEREADRALIAAKAAVREAREHVKRLEREAAEEARLAKIKQSQARSMGKRGKALGRHDHI
ncbi:hypothetical protein P154DRAFT_532841 [Amniculicola lignicola CBS 123094]|uniref:Uncharacterized protein n=1 Tax=Amniculicola lignicola CBS 123094 TaxID=1392246 RepID=A0A6A5WLL5_9PLEO|nr:hypothetical protein P154DRAFT_532841 [Amniculicola lignicola CBS 123094]